MFHDGILKGECNCLKCHSVELTIYDESFIDNLKITDDDIETDFSDEEFIPETRQFVITIYHHFYDKEADLIKKQILKAFEMKNKAEIISIYVRMLQDGDPENENPKEILDYIEQVLSKEEDKI
jgi:hypothetical protein